MGTVGISFGSPTGGTGFDVSNTVSQIVANLQNVETPWKTQLTTLQSQDTVISSLGNLLSTLSTDVGSLTDFQGVLAGKQGSSSDTNVLQLTSASPSAVAGTHSIVVNSLAATSSGSLKEITAATDTLSGSITIQVGSGTAHTITIDSTSNTLASLSSAINSAGIGVSASVLTDANGSRLSLVSSTSGSGGNLTVTSAVTDSTTSTALAYTAATTGVNASLTVDGVPISASSNTVSTVIPGVTFQLLAPSPVTSGTPETVQVEVLNNNSAVVSSVAQMVSDYNAVISAVNAQETRNSSGTPQPLFGTPTLTLLQEQLLSSITGTSPNGYLTAISNSSDTLSGSLSIAVGSGSATTFNLSSLPSGNQNLLGLAAAINTANIGVTASVLKDSAGLSRLSLSSSGYGANASLTVSSAVTDSATSAALAWNANSDIKSLLSLGVSQNSDGTISLDQGSLNNELNSDYSGVLAFFQNSYDWGTTFSTTISNLGTSSTSGTLALALSSDSSIESSLNLNISNEQLLISTEQISLTAELNSANEILQSIPSNLNSVSELYSAITGYVAPKF
jgi:flagellar hook-associated protein 2